MFEYLKHHDQIVVTGPHRSGTTIVMEMIAHDLNYERYREEKGSVYQVPLLSSKCHELPDYVAVVFVRRPEEDILASQKRINWGDEDNKINEFHEITKYHDFVSLLDSEWSAAKVKYEVWKRAQKEKIRHPYEINYNSLFGHPLWIPKEKRKNFNPRQTVI